MTAVDDAVRSAPRPGHAGRGAAARQVRSHLGPALLAVLACGASLAALVVLATGGVWHLTPAPQLLVDATVGSVYPVIALVIMLAPGIGRGTRAPA